jgi:hypothetical protein
MIVEQESRFDSSADRETHRAVKIFLILNGTSTPDVCTLYYLFESVYVPSPRLEIKLTRVAFQKIDNSIPNSTPV